MNNQQAWEKSLLGVYNQKGPSMEIGFGCVYRSPDGLKKCGIGHLIKDKDYCKDWEGSSINNILSSLPKYVTKLNTNFLFRLQRCHDEASVSKEKFIVEFLERMIDLGENYNLDVSKAKRRLRYIKKEKK